MSAPRLTGVNYWPASSAMRWWTRFDAVEVERDFARIAAAGGRLVRFFLLWEDFQPRPTDVARDALARLGTVADIAERAGVAIMPTLFTGHMSGANFIPEWALGGRVPAGRFRVIAADRVAEREPRNWYADEEITHAQALLARECARTLTGHPALWGWDLGNENSNCCMPPSREAAKRWLGLIAGAIRGVDASCHLTLGLHLEDLEEDRRLGPAEAAEVCDVLSMHGYPIYARWSAGPMDDDFCAFLADITRWLGGRDVLFAEFGAPTRSGDADAERHAGPMLLSEDDAARYTASALSRLRDAGTLGGLVWCYADYARAIWHEPPLDRAPHERHFGLWRADGSEKPAVSALATSDVRRVTPLPSWSEAERERYRRDPRKTLIELYAKFRAARPATKMARALL